MTGAMDWPARRENPEGAARMDAARALSDAADAKQAEAAEATTSADEALTALAAMRSIIDECETNEGEQL